MPIDVSLREKIKMYALELGIGSSSQHQVCPTCGGGSDKEKSFTVTRYSNGLFYNCFRAKCGFKGFIPTSIFTIMDDEGYMPRPPPKRYNGEAITLEDDDKSYLKDLWGLRDSELSSQGFGKDHESYDLVMPLYTLEGYDAGTQLRRLDGRKPKVLTFWEDNVVKIHFPLRDTKTREIFLVEDIPSAIKASRYMSAAALCGTALPEDVVAFLSKHFDTVYLALDNDATDKAIRYKRKYCLSFGNFTVVPLSKDVKNMNDDALNNLMRGFAGGETTARSIS